MLFSVFEIFVFPQGEYLVVVPEPSSPTNCCECKPCKFSVKKIDLYFQHKSLDHRKPEIWENCKDCKVRNNVQKGEAFT